jgi:hypothetical protein
VKRSETHRNIVRSGGLRCASPALRISALTKKFQVREYILPLGIICAFKIRRKTVLQTVSPQKRFAKSFYKSAIYDGGKNKLIPLRSRGFVTRKNVSSKIFFLTV